MKRKVIGYDKTLEYLKKGNEIVHFPMYDNWFMYVPVINGDYYSQEYITVRNDTIEKLLWNGIIKKSRMEHYTTFYKLDKKENL